jgi:MFS family permease
VARPKPVIKGLRAIWGIQMKFDMSRAWNDAVAMMSANRDLLLVVAGIFFFLPSLASAMLVPNMQEAMIGDPDRMMEMMTELYADYWWIILLVTLTQGIGYLALLALLRDSGNPTVGEAIKTGLIGIVPYIVANMLAALAGGLVVVLLATVGGATGSGLLTGILMIAGFIVAIYLFVKFCLSGPVIAIEKRYNPLAALARSWQLTKGNSFRLFLFFVLLFLVYLVISIVVGGILGLLLALFPAGAVVTAIQGAISGLLGAVLTVVIVSVLAAIHGQLAGPSPEAVSETFE